MSEQALREIAVTLRELLKWSRFAGMQQLRNVLLQNLKTDVEKLVFELSDGVHGTREIAKLSGIGSNATVAAYWKKWSRVGIVEPTPKYQGRYQKICSLEDVGLEAPTIPQNIHPKVEDLSGEQRGERQDE